jgi:hypothetical protein
MPWNRVLALCVVLMVAATLMAQNITGSIAGTVTDPSGAVVSNATVTITNTDTNVMVRTVKTDAAGGYSAPLLPIGHYVVTVEAPGFAKYSERGIELNVNEKLTVNARMKVAAAGQEVVVEANPLQVDLQGTAATGLVTGTQIRGLALNTRNYEQLVTLLPGVSNSATTDQIYVGAFSPQGTNVVSFSVNGNRTSQNNWTIDGADNVDRGSNLTLLSFPSVDALAEFKVVRGAYDAEFGRGGGSQVNVVTKSGTNSFHGGAYEFARNDAFVANDYFNIRTQLAAGHKNIPPALRYNNFGYNIGGPIWKDKTFFFFSQEFRRVITYFVGTGVVPTQDQRNGVFAHPVCVTFNPNGTCATGGTSTTIDSINFSPLATQYLNAIWSHVPYPNDPATSVNSLTDTYRNIFNFREELVKIDHNFGSKLTLNGKYLRDTIPTEEPRGLFTNINIPGVANTSTEAPGRNYTIHATATISPTFLINAGYGYSYGAILSHMTGLIATASSQITPTLVFPNTQGRAPHLSFSGGTSIASFGPYDDRNYNHSAFGNVTKIWGGHTVKAGMVFYHYRKNENAGGGPQGSFSFNNAGAPSGTTAYEQSWANFLLGRTSLFTQSNIDITADLRTNQFEWFVQDEWRVRPNLTISYGVRHSLFRQPTDAHGLLSNFDPRAYNAADAPCIAPNGNIDPTCAAGSTPGTPDYSITNGIIFQGNRLYGSKVAAEDNNNFAPRLGLAWDPFKDGRTSIRAGYGMFYDSILFGNAEINIFNNPPTVNSVSIPNTSFDNPASGTPSVSLAPKRVRSLIDPKGTTPYTQQWSLDFQHDMGLGFLLDLGYYGSKGTHLIGSLDVNQPAPFAYRDALACSATVTTNCIQPGNFVTSATTPLLNRIRPYTGYVGIDGIRSEFSSNYHSLQAQLQKRFRGSSLLNFSYTWSHNLTNNQTDRSTAPQNSYDIAAEYGPSQQDRRHIFTANWVYDLPFYKTQAGFVGHVLGGWTFSGIFTAQTGIPGTVTTLANADPGGTGCLGPSPCSVRPDQISDPNMGAPQTLDQWFNKAAYVNVPAGEFHNGTSHRGAVYGPGLWRADLSLFKGIRFTERVNGQFRFETFNAFNHLNPNCCGSFSLGSSLFAKITSGREPRIVQLGFKLDF